MTYKNIVLPDRLITRAEIRSRPCPVPSQPGVYGWYFDELPGAFDVTNCVNAHGMILLYIGIAPHGASSSSHLRRRIKQHCRDRGSSTLRKTLAALLRERLDLVPGAGTRGRLLLADDAEARLSDWIAAHAAVTWAITPTPWLAEIEFLTQLDLPLNLVHNTAHKFRRELASARATAQSMVRTARLLAPGVESEI